MMTVEVPVPADDVSTLMRKMRQWLDDMRFEPWSFNWGDVASRAVNWSVQSRRRSHRVRCALRRTRALRLL
jgi:hypothetical protein